MVTLYIIRHAEAEGNLYRRLHGWCDGKLTANGLRQVEALCDALRGTHIDACYASDLSRAMSTAAAVRDACDLDILPTPGLREITMGDWEDIQFGNAYAINPDFEECFITPDNAVTDVDERRGIAVRERGTTMRDVYNRIVPCVLDIVSRHDGEAVALVSHSCAIRALLSYMLYGTADRVGDVPNISNTGISRVVFDNGVFTLDYVNHDDHIAGLPSRFPKPVPGFSKPFLRFESAKDGGDIEAAVGLWRETWLHVNGFDEGFSYSYAHHEMERMFRNNPRSVRLAYLDDKLAGCVVLDTANLQERDCGHISLLMLKEQYRGYGVGVQLLGEAVYFYRAMGRDYLRLRTDRKNSKAMRFYSYNGFSVAQTDDSGDYIMKKAL